MQNILTNKYKNVISLTENNIKNYKCSKLKAKKIRKFRIFIKYNYVLFL